MITKTLRILSAAVLLGVTLQAQALALADAMPVAPDVKAGRLENGLTDAAIEAERAMVLEVRKHLCENGYWLSGLQDAYANGTDPAILLRQEQRIAAITPAALQAAARRHIKFDNYVQVVLYPSIRQAAANN